MTPAHELERDIDIDLGGLASALWRRRVRLLVIGVASALLAFLVLQFVSPKYQAETRILIESRNREISRSNSGIIEQQRTLLDQQGIASQVQIITSRDVALAVIHDLKLDKKKEFDTALAGSGITDILFMIGLINDPTAGTPEERALKSFYKKLKVNQVASTRVINIKFSSKDPDIAAAVPEAIAREYLKIQAEAKQGLNKGQAQALKPQIEKQRRDVRAAEAAVAAYRGASKGLLLGRNNATIATQQLGDMSAELSRVRAQRAAAVAKVSAISNALRSGAPIDSISDVLSAPLIQRLRERQVTLRAQIAELSATLLPAHPRIKSLNSQLGNLNQQIRNEAQKILRAMRGDARIARSREQELMRNLQVLTAEAARIGEEQVTLSELERKAASKRDLLKDYERRYSEAVATQQNNLLAADARIISGVTYPSEPYFPKVLPIVVGAFFGSILIASMVILGAALLREKPEYVANENEHDNIPETDAPRVMASLDEETDPYNGQREEFDDGVATAAASIAKLGKARIALLSPEGEVGSEGSVLLARYLSRGGASVVVIDMTGAGASSRAMIGGQQLPGIKDLLAGGVSFGDVIHNDRASRAHIIPTGVASAATAALAGDRLVMVFDALEDTYDFVIIDCGAADSAGLSRISNADTINVINAIDENDPSVQIAAEALVSAGFSHPLIIHPSDAERREMGMAAA